MEQPLWRCLPLLRVRTRGGTSRGETRLIRGAGHRSSAHPARAVLPRRGGPCPCGARALLRTSSPFIVEAMAVSCDVSDRNNCKRHRGILVPRRGRGARAPPQLLHSVDYGSLSSPQHSHSAHACLEPVPCAHACGIHAHKGRSRWPARCRARPPEAYQQHPYVPCAMLTVRPFTLGALPRCHCFRSMTRSPQGQVPQRCRLTAWCRCEHA